MTLNPTCNDLIKEIRSDKLPILEEACAQIQKEQGSLKLFGGNGDFVNSNKGLFKHAHRKVLVCDHQSCKKINHTKDHLPSSQTKYVQGTKS